jgi:hypothetical protein
MRRFVAFVFMAATVVTLGPRLDACGDKSLSAGGIRMQRALAARYPASILAYVPSNGSRVAEAVRGLNFQDNVRLVGHKYQEVGSLVDLDTRLQTGQFNIIVADMSDIGDLQRRLGEATSRAVVIPVAYQLTKEESRELAKQCRFVIKAPSRAAEYLNTIAQAVRSRSTASRKG